MSHNCLKIRLLVHFSCSFGNAIDFFSLKFSETNYSTLNRSCYFKPEFAINLVRIALCIYTLKVLPKFLLMFETLQI